MQRPTIIVLPPVAPSPGALAEVTAGIQCTWGSAWYAAGADVFAPAEPLDPSLDPFIAAGRVRGVSLAHAHDGSPVSGHIDAIVLGELDDTGGWQLPIRILRREQAPVDDPGPTRRGPAALLEVLEASVHTVSEALNLRLPGYVDWRTLLRARTPAEGLADLRSIGRRILGQLDGASPLLH